MANEVSIKLSRSAVIGGRTIGGVDELVPADHQQVFQESVPDGASDRVITLATTVANILVSAVHATQNLTIKTYDGVTLKQTIAVTKNVGLIWSINQPTALALFTDNFDSVKVTNASGYDGVLHIGIASQQDAAGDA